MYNYTEYLEPYLREVRELAVLGEAIDPKAQATHRHMEQTYDNQFIGTCEEATMRRREKLFQISADPGRETLQFRRKRLIHRYTMKLPLTMNFLLCRLDEIIGVGQYAAWVEYGDWNYRLGHWRLGQAPFQDEAYVLHIEAVAETAGWYHEVHLLVNKIKPAHIVFAFSPRVGQGMVMSETIGTFPMVWNYHLGHWRLGRKPFLSGGEPSLWNYRLGHWRLGQSPFGEQPTMEVVKVPEASSLKSDFLNVHSKLTAASIAAVRLNGCLVISDLKKVAEAGTTTIRYTVSALMGLKELTRIELLLEDGTVLTGSELYLPVPKMDQIVVKHVISHEEGTANV